jgi:aryl-alcohol dehydrogenase-like predicted oxidoreductase
LIGNFLAGSASPLVIATKFMPYPWRWTKGALSRALRRSLERLKLEKVDLYQIHWDWPPVSIETWADALADVVQQGLARAVGVSNYDEAQMRRANAVLAKRGVPLASNQVEYSLIHRHVEFNGVLKACQELNITLIAYSPIGMGVLTGKYGPDKPLPGFRGRRYNRAYLQKVQPLMSLIGEVGRAHDGKTSSQVALNWLMCKGVLPIPGAKNLHQARENIGALGWRLSESEVKALDEASANLR